jgi:hypothetical protein
MENISLAVALIRKSGNLGLSWLARLDRIHKRLEFVIGERLEGESFRETTIREVAWAMQLDRKRDFLVSNMAQMNLEFVDQLPGHFEKSHVQVSFYNVEIYRKEVVQLLDKDPNNFWVNSEEICNGVTRCGRIFSPIIPYLVKRSNVIQHWESSSGNS